MLDVPLTTSTCVHCARALGTVRATCVHCARAHGTVRAFTNTLTTLQGASCQDGLWT